jgi:hypothetical protein
MNISAACTTIAESPFFDADWYVQRYRHVAQSGHDPALHYLLLGDKTGCDPGPGFSTAGYLAANPDVARAGVNPLVHYERIGRQEGRGGFQTAHTPAETPAPAHSRSLPSRDTLADYTILTPTGDRAVAYNRCMDMVMNQSVQPRQWVIVDDGVVPLVDQVTLPDWVTYVRREPHPADPPHTLSSNLLAALDHVTCDKVLIFEDDDWYAPGYAEFMLPFLEDHDLVGLNNIRYYLLRAAMWKTGTPPRHTAFAQSGFRRGHAWDHLLAVCRTNFPEVRERGVLDRYWWHSFEGNKHLIADHPGLHLGLKGGFGRAGLAEGHLQTDPGYMPDTDRSYLRTALGDDMARYSRWQNLFPKPYVLYTTLEDGQIPADPPTGCRPYFDFYAFCDHALPEGCLWQAVPYDRFPEEAGARRLKPQVLPHLYFPEYDWSLFSDPAHIAQLDPGGLIASAIEARKPFACASQEGVPALARRHANPAVVGAMLDWWRDVLAGKELSETPRFADLA